MKVIDFAKKGNVVRFFLGEDSLATWYGDDWDDTPYEHNAGTVYDEFVSGVFDFAFPFRWLVLEPCEDWNNGGNSPYCKDDLREGRAPCIVAIPPDMCAGSFDDSFSFWVGARNAVKIYFGDSESELAALKERISDEDKNA